jgi:glycogen operon protein
LPEAVGGRQWVRLIDTNRGHDDEMQAFDFAHSYEVTGRSLLLFILRPARQKGMSTDADRSFQHVMEVLEAATSTPVGLN